VYCVLVREGLAKVKRRLRMKIGGRIEMLYLGV